MRTVTLGELPGRLELFVKSDNETRNHDHYSKYRGGVEWECELPTKQARTGCYSDMLKRMRGMLPKNWTVSKLHHNGNKSSAKIGPVENISDPAMKSNMKEEAIRKAVRRELRSLNEAAMTKRKKLVKVRPDRFNDEDIELQMPSGESYRFTPQGARNLIKSIEELL
jgi:hypothetical protein